jgi:hypothetical protein
MSQARDAEMSRWKEVADNTYEMAPGDDAKSSRSSVSLKILVTKKGQLSESHSSSSC